MIFVAFLGTSVLHSFHSLLHCLKLSRTSKRFFTIFTSFIPDGAHFVCLVLFQQSLLQLLSVMLNRINSLSNMIKTIIVDNDSILTPLMMLLRFMPLIGMGHFFVWGFVDVDGVHIHKGGLPFLVLVVVELVLAGFSMFLGGELRGCQETADSAHVRNNKMIKLIWLLTLLHPMARNKVLIALRAFLEGEH